MGLQGKGALIGPEQRLEGRAEHSPGGGGGPPPSLLRVNCVGEPNISRRVRSGVPWMVTLSVPEVASRPGVLCQNARRKLQRKLRYELYA